MSTNGGCERKRELLDNLLRVLSRLSEPEKSAAQMLREGPDSRLVGLVSEQERAINAIEEHQQQHGC